MMKIDKAMFETVFAHLLHGGLHRLLKTGDGRYFEEVFTTDEYGCDFQQIWPLDKNWTGGGYEPSHRAWLTTSALYDVVTKNRTIDWYHLHSICKRNDEINAKDDWREGWKKPSQKDVELVLMAILEGHVESLFSHI